MCVFSFYRKRNMIMNAMCMGPFHGAAIKLSHRMLPLPSSLPATKHIKHIFIRWIYVKKKHNALVCYTLSLFHSSARATLSSQHFDRVFIGYDGRSTKTVPECIEFWKWAQPKHIFGHFRTSFDTKKKIFERILMNIIIVTEEVNTWYYGWWKKQASFNSYASNCSENVLFGGRLWANGQLSVLRTYKPDIIVLMRLKFSIQKPKVTPLFTTITGFHYQMQPVFDATVFGLNLNSFSWYIQHLTASCQNIAFELCIESCDTSMQQF